MTQTFGYFLFQGTAQTQSCDSRKVDFLLLLLFFKPLFRLLSLPCCCLLLSDSHAAAVMTVNARDAAAAEPPRHKQNKREREKKELPAQCARRIFTKPLIDFSTSLSRSFFLSFSFFLLLIYNTTTFRGRVVLKKWNVIALHCIASLFSFFSSVFLHSLVKLWCINAIV